jgi:hypothetical protein
LAADARHHEAEGDPKEQGNPAHGSFLLSLQRLYRHGFAAQQKGFLGIAGNGADGRGWQERSALKKKMPAAMTSEGEVATSIRTMGLSERSRSC